MASEAVPEIGNSAYFAQVMFGLLVVLASIVLIAWLARRFGAGSFLGTGEMKVVGSVAVGARERAVMIDVAGQQMLLGVAPGRVNLLHVFEEPVVNTGKSRTGEDAAATYGRAGEYKHPSDFKKRLSDFMSGNQHQ